MDHGKVYGENLYDFICTYGIFFAPLHTLYKTFFMKKFYSIFSVFLLVTVSLSAQTNNNSDTLHICDYDDLDLVDASGAILAEFSVSDSTKVYFSQGNLQYQASTNTWRFAEHQWDCVGDSIKGNVYENGVKSDNLKFSPTYDGWIDLFGWGTSGYNSVYPYDNYACAFDGESTDIANTNYDWGVYNAISNGGTQAGQWRTLTKDEWYYVINTRANASSKYGVATVSDVTGLILLPDNWTLPEGLTFTSEANGDYAQNTFSTADWTKMEANGAVFLPAAGGRGGTDVYNVGSYGYYWSSSANDYNGADYLGFNSYYVDTDDYGHRYGEKSVRLVQDVKK